LNFNPKINQVDDNLTIVPNTTPKTKESKEEIILHLRRERIKIENLISLIILLIVLQPVIPFLFFIYCQEYSLALILSATQKSIIFPIITFILVLIVWKVIRNYNMKKNELPKIYHNFLPKSWNWKEILIVPCGILCGYLLYLGMCELLGPSFDNTSILRDVIYGILPCIFIVGISIHIFRRANKKQILKYLWCMVFIIVFTILLEHTTILEFLPL
jgi:hypothetical protein